MIIRLAKQDDLKAIMAIFDYAVDYMATTGNPRQWSKRYPTQELIEEDIRKQQCYVCCDGDDIHGVFVLSMEKEAEYDALEAGAWLNQAPYGTIHRLAGDGKVKGISKFAIDFCKQQTQNLRADTHQDNRIMQHLLEKNGFLPCGRLPAIGGGYRIAYHYVGV